jgi:integrase
VHATFRSANVGKTVIANVGKMIATALKLPEPEKYTGHVFRRTGITLMANTGASLVQIKAYSGHHSDAVAQRYVDTSTAMKTTASDATALRPPMASVLGKRPSAPTGNGTYNINISVAGDVSGSLGLWGKE